MYEKCHIMKRECVCDRRDTENRVFFIDLDKRKERDYIKIIGRLNNSLRFDNVFLSMDVTGNGKDDIVHIVDGCLSVYEIDNNYQLQLL